MSCETASEVGLVPVSGQSRRCVPSYRMRRSWGRTPFSEEVIEKRYARRFSTRLPESAPWET
jgi:hypothetical protein